MTAPIQPSQILLSSERGILADLRDENRRQANLWEETCQWRGSGNACISEGTVGGWYHRNVRGTRDERDEQDSRTSWVAPVVHVLLGSLTFHKRQVSNQ